jgi:GAF domain-containing protein
VILAIALAAVLVGGMAGFTLLRLQKWDEMGWVGMSWIQMHGEKAPKVFGMHDGQIIVVYQGTPAERAGIKPGDVIRAIGGIGRNEIKRLRVLDERVKAGDSVVFTLERGKATRDVALRFESPLRSRFLWLTLIVYSGVAAAFVAIGLLVFTRRPDDRRVVVFYAMVIVGALSLIGVVTITLDAGNLRGIVTEPRGVVFLVLVASFAIIFIPLTLHLSLVFPEDRPVVRRNPQIFRWVYGIPSVALFVFLIFATAGTLAPQGEHLSKAIERSLDIGSAVFAVAGLLAALRIARRARTEGARAAFVNRPLQSLFTFFAAAVTLVRIAGALKLKGVTIGLVLTTVGLPLVALFVYPILSCIALYRSYRDAGVEQRRQVKWPLWGTFVAIATKVVVDVGSQILVFASMFGGASLGRWMTTVQYAGLIPTIVYLAIPISFAVAILKYRLMNIDVIIKKTVAYTILSGLIIVLYLGLVGGLGTLLVNVAGMRNQTMVIVSTLVVALVFVPLRNGLQRLVDKNLFRQKTDYPQALRTLTADTLAATDTHAFLFLTSEIIQQALQNRSIVIFTRRGDDLVATAKVGVADSLLGTLRFSAEAAEDIERPLDPRKRLWIEEAQRAIERVEASLVVPIRTHGTTHGLIALGSKLSDREFDLEDIEFLSSAAGQVAIGIDRIRLGREEVDFEQARRMQQALLPSSLPQIEGLQVAGTWEPARAVGGDYYDVLELSPSQLAVCIGDVAGKGMPAALLMSALQAAVRASAAENIAPRDLCERVRRVVVPNLSGRFVTFFFCTIDTGSRRVHFCNAGHNPPILARADGSVVRLSAGGPALSRLFTPQRYIDETLELLPGDRLVLFTDGVSEARDAADNEFGEQRLEQAVAANRHLGAQAIIEQISAAVSSFSGGRTDDDLTLVTVAFTPPA